MPREHNIELQLQMEENRSENGLNKSCIIYTIQSYLFNTLPYHRYRQHQASKWTYLKKKKNIYLSRIVKLNLKEDTTILNL